MAVGRKSGKLVGLDTSTRMAMNVAFAPDREQTGVRELQHFSQVDEVKSTLAQQPFRIQFISGINRGSSTMTEVEIKAADASAAIVAAANVALPPRTIEVRILDSGGREVFSRRRSDRSGK